MTRHCTDCNSEIEDGEAVTCAACREALSNRVLSDLVASNDALRTYVTQATEMIEELAHWLEHLVDYRVADDEEDIPKSTVLREVRAAKRLIERAP